MMPGMMIACPSRGVYQPALLACDVGKYKPGEIEWETEWDPAARSFLLLLDALNCDLDEIRAGVEMVQDCKEMGWGNVNMEVEKRSADLYQDAYPAKFKKIVLVDTGFIVGAIIKVSARECVRSRAERMPKGMPMNNWRANGEVQESAREGQGLNRSFCMNREQTARANSAV